MPHAFTVEVAVRANGETHKAEFNSYGCRESFIINLCDQTERTFVMHHAVNQGVWLLESPVDLRSKCALKLCSVSPEKMIPVCEELRARWFPEVSFSFEIREIRSFDVIKENYCVVESKGLLSISFMWWLILAWRLLDSQPQSYENLEALIRGNKSGDYSMQWYHSSDHKAHLDLIPNFSRVRYFEMWKILGNIANIGVYGPVMALEYAGFIKEKTGYIL